MFPWKCTFDLGLAWKEEAKNLFFSIVVCTGYANVHGDEKHSQFALFTWWPFSKLERC